MSTKTLIVVVGATAVGKTAFSIQLAKRLGTEIISSDSRQFYKEMCVGTAVPSSEELQQIPHHFIQHKSIEDTYTVGDYEKDVGKKLPDLFKQHKTVILTGGSGLYTDAVLYGLDYFPKISSSIRQNLKKEFDKYGLSFLQEKLKEIDPVSYQQIDIQNSQRLIRALEVSVGTGHPFSSFKKKQQKQQHYKLIKIGLNAERIHIYNNIEKRTDQMIENGLIAEAQKLYNQRNLNALQTVGYKEVFSYIEGKTSLENAIEEIKKNTRRYAKRQLTWLRKDSSIIWKSAMQDKQKIVNDVVALL